MLFVAVDGEVMSDLSPSGRLLEKFSQNHRKQPGSLIRSTGSLLIQSTALSRDSKPRHQLEGSAMPEIAENSWLSAATPGQGVQGAKALEIAWKQVLGVFCLFWLGFPFNYKKGCFKALV